jgi:hypothetical protein
MEDFVPPQPFNLVELDPVGVLPERVYSRGELLIYLDFCRKKCQSAVDSLSEESARKICRFSWKEVSYAELLLEI